MTAAPQTILNHRVQLRLLRKRLLLVLASVLFALLIVEAALRLIGFTYFNAYTTDPQVGYTLRPNAEGWWTREGRTYVRINSQGFRDREHVIAKPADTFRIAVLGDSFAEAFNVPIEKAFWSVMAPQISACVTQKKRVEILNFGVSGFSQARELILLENRVWQYSPDMVLVLFTPGNDVRDNSRTLSRYGALPLPYFVIRERQLVLDDWLLIKRNSSWAFRLRKSLFGQAFDWTRDHSRVLGLIHTMREAEFFSGDDNRNGNEPGLDREVYRPPTTPEWEDAWQLTEQLIAKMRDEVQGKGAKFLVVSGTASIQVNPDEEKRRKFMETLGVDNLFYPGDRLKVWGMQNGVRVIDLARPLQDYGKQNAVFTHGTAETGKGHWNELGHRFVGELIAKEVCRYAK